MDAYEELSRIGRGAEGTCYLCRLRETGEARVVKKVFLRNGRQSSVAEASILSQLQHPFVVRYYDSFLDATGDHLCLVMEHCAGGSLDERIRKAKEAGETFSERQIMDWFVQITLAMRYIHSQKILHRDLKTPNIFLTADNMIKVGDFGIAAQLENTLDLKRTCVGSPYYMSPEVVQDIPYNFKSDVWSLGCVLFELCCLTPAFGGRNLMKIVTNIIGGEREAVPETFSAELRSLVERMLDVDAKTRPSVHDVITTPYFKESLKTFEHLLSHTVATKSSSTPEVPAEPVNLSDTGKVKVLPRSRRAKAYRQLGTKKKVRRTNKSNGSTSKQSTRPSSAKLAKAASSGDRKRSSSFGSASSSTKSSAGKPPLIPKKPKTTSQGSKPKSKLPKKKKKRTRPKRCKAPTPSASPQTVPIISDGETGSQPVTDSSPEKPLDLVETTVGLGVGTSLENTASTSDVTSPTSLPTCTSSPKTEPETPPDLSRSKRLEMLVGNDLTPVLSSESLGETSPEARTTTVSQPREVSPSAHEYESDFESVSSGSSSSDWDSDEDSASEARQGWQDGVPRTDDDISEDLSSDSCGSDVYDLMEAMSLARVAIASRAEDYDEIDARQEPAPIVSPPRTALKSHVVNAMGEDAFQKVVQFLEGRALDAPLPEDIDVFKTELMDLVGADLLDTCQLVLELYLLDVGLKNTSTATA